MKQIGKLLKQMTVMLWRSSWMKTTLLMLRPFLDIHLSEGAQRGASVFRQPCHKTPANATIVSRINQSIFEHLLLRTVDPSVTDTHHNNEDLHWYGRGVGRWWRYYLTTLAVFTAFFWIRIESHGPLNVNHIINNMVTSILHHCVKLLSLTSSQVNVTTTRKRRERDCSLFIIWLNRLVG